MNESGQYSSSGIRGQEMISLTEFSTTHLSLEEGFVQYQLPSRHRARVKMASP